MNIFLISRIFQTKNSVATKEYIKLKSSYKIHDHIAVFSSSWQIIDSVGSEGFVICEFS